MMWLYFLSEKSEAFPTFLQFKALVEKQSGCQIQTLRPNHGGEFIYTAFMNYCKENGIQRQLTVRRTPQQNGVTGKKKSHHCGDGQKHAERPRFAEKIIG